MPMCHVFFKNLAKKCRENVESIKGFGFSWVIFYGRNQVNMSFPFLGTRFHLIFPHSTTLPHFYQKTSKKALRATVNTYGSLKCTQLCTSMSVGQVCPTAH